MPDLPEEPVLRILVVASDPLARSGLAALLVESGSEVAGQVTSDEDLVEQASIFRPDVILWDLGWDFGDGTSYQLERLAELSESGSPTVVLLPHRADPRPAWDAGARCILFRDATPAQLRVALWAALQGLVVLDRELSPDIVSARDVNSTGLIEELTPREVEVLQLLADGLTNRAIGQKLGISEHTVKFHVNAILGKLQAQSRTEAVVRAARLGLLLL
jgi:two-component system, NarL family, nitrate/nitrite response regulator NarL